MLVAGVGRSGVAQSTDENLKKAVDMYTAFNIEGARPILLNIISPNYLLSVSTDQKVKALKYLGASYAVLDKRDSAVTFFTAALDYNPFTDLDPREFSAAELAAFSDAKQKIFKIAIRPIVPKILDNTYQFSLITTHRANITVEFFNRDSTKREMLYQGDNDGAREMPFKGLMRDGTRVDSTTWEFRVKGASRVQSGSA